VFVKICGITNEDDALYSVAMGADAVGFVFAPSPRQVSPQVVYDITRRLPPEILTVGVFRDELPERIFDVVTRSGVKAVQLHGQEPPSTVAALSDSVRWIIKGVVAGSREATRANRYGTDLILVDSPNPGSGRTWDWSLANKLPGGLRVILAGGLNPENVGEAVAAVQPWGVDVSSGVEAQAGKKDPVKVRRFIQAARAASPDLYVSDDFPYDWSDE